MSMPPPPAPMLPGFSALRMQRSALSEQPPQDDHRSWAASGPGPGLPPPRPPPPASATTVDGLRALPPLRSTFRFGDDRAAAPRDWEQQAKAPVWGVHLEGHGYKPAQVSPQDAAYQSPRDRVAPMDRRFSTARALGAPAPSMQSSQHIQPPLHAFHERDHRHIRQPQDQHQHEHQHQHHPHQHQHEHQHQQQRHHHSHRSQATRYPQSNSSEEDERASSVGNASTSSGAAKKRSRRMSNSERGKLYRSRRKDYVDSLEQTVDDLKREIEQLKISNGRHVAAGPPRAPPNEDALTLQTIPRSVDNASMARTVSEYFALFAHGVVVDHPPSQALPHAPQHMVVRTSDGASPHGGINATQQAAFLRWLVAPNLTFGGQQGLQTLLKQWERYSKYHAALTFTLTALRVDTSEVAPSVTAFASLAVRFSRLTFQKIFPTMLQNEPLLQKLIGREVVYPVETKFFFNRQDGKIERFDVQVDFVTTFTELLGDARDAMEIVGSAAIRANHLLVNEDGDDDSDGLADSNGQQPVVGNAQEPEEPAQMHFHAAKTVFPGVDARQSRLATEYGEDNNDRGAAFKLPRVAYDQEGRDGARRGGGFPSTSSSSSTSHWG